MSGATHCHHGIPLHLPCRDCPGEVISSNLVSRLRSIETRGERTIWTDAADEIERLTAERDNWRRAAEAKQAKIDALMLEFCPGEMPGEQRKAWAENQRPASETSARQSVTLNGYQLKEALDFIAPDGEAEQLDSDVTIEWGDNGHSGPGYYAHITEYPDEGSVLLDDKPPTHLYELWHHMHTEHGLTLLQSELAEIVRIAVASQDGTESRGAHRPEVTRATGERS